MKKIRSEKYKAKVITEELPVTKYTLFEHFIHLIIGVLCILIIPVLLYIFLPLSF